jgi:D-amino-acid dehydrogenase
MLGEAKVVVTPMAETLRIAGTLELAGFDPSINRRRVDAILRSAARYIGGAADLGLVEIWRGWRPCTPDGLPIIGRSERFANLILATGHGMLGVSLGPVTGKLVAQLASGDEPMIGLGPVRPGRF